MTDEARARARKAVVATSLGNALEWFDIIVYAFFAAVISKNFFPESLTKDGGFMGMMLTFLTFFLSYLIRPFGAMYIGNYGDKKGRKAAMTMTIALMTAGLFIIVVVPNYASIGVAAPLLLMVARLMQGFSAGGEFGSATAFLTENAPTKKAFYASWQVATQGVSMFLAGGFGYLLNTRLSSEALVSWGWRVPFAFGLLIGPVGWYIRKHMDDTPEFEAIEETEKSPLATTFLHHFPRVLTAAACVGTATIAVYTISYMPTYAIKLGLPGWSAYLGSVVGGLTMFIGSPFVGRLTDRVGAIPIMLPAAALGAVMIYPLFKMLTDKPTVGMLTLVQIMVGLVMTSYFAPLPSLMSAIFPTQIRTTGMSLAYNIGVTCFGALAPLVLTWLIEKTGSSLAPSYWFMVVCVISCGGLVFARRVYHQR